MRPHWRDDFPLIVERGDVAYLDNAATTQKPQRVLDAVRDYYRRTNANVHRAAHRLSDDATRAFEAARQTVRATHQRPYGEGSRLDARHHRSHQPGRRRLCAAGVGRRRRSARHGAGAPLQHRALAAGLRPLRGHVASGLRAAKRRTRHGGFQAKLREHTKIVAVGHVSNALGTVNDLETIIALAKAVGAAVVVDGAQAMAHFDVDVQALGCDFYAFSGHKMYAPTGIGALYGREEMLQAMPPWQTGGEMIERVRIEATTYAALPFKFEAGTPNIAGAIGLAAAVDYLNDIDFAAAQVHEADVLAYATASLQQVEGLSIVGTAPHKGPVLSFVMDDAHPHDVGTLLDQQGVAVRTGHHCAMPLMDRLGIPGTVRASFSLYNDRDDVNRMVAAVRKAGAMLVA